MADHEARARNREARAAEALCKKHGLVFPKHVWALCALAKGESVSSHHKKGPCRCSEPPKFCQRCCPKCDNRKLKLRDLDLPKNGLLPPALVTPTERISKVRAKAKIQEIIRDDMNFLCELADERKGRSLPAAGDKSLMDVLKYLEMDPKDTNDTPSPKWVSTSAKAHKFFAADDRQTARLVNSMTKACAKVVEIGAGKSPQAVAEGYKQRVAASLTKRAKKALEDCTALSAAASPEGEAPRGASPAEIVSESESNSNESEDSGDEAASNIPESEGGSDESINNSADPLMDISNEDAKKERSQLISALLEICKAHVHNRRHPVYQTARAALVRGVKAGRLNQVKAGNGNRLFGKKARLRAKQDMVAAVNGSLVLPPPITRQRIGDYSLKFAITCMLSTDNIGHWSWGTKEVTIASRNGLTKDSFVLPKIFTRKTKKDIYNHYIDTFNAEDDRPTSNPLGKTLFMDILSNIVSGDSRMQKAVDYVTGLLLHDTCNILLRLIKDLLGSNQNKVKQYIEWLEVT